MSESKLMKLEDHLVLHKKIQKKGRWEDFKNRLSYIYLLYKSSIITKQEYLEESEKVTLKLALS